VVLATARKVINRLAAALLLGSIYNLALGNLPLVALLTIAGECPGGGGGGCSL
jgi:hypothetical protein